MKPNSEHGYLEWFPEYGYGRHTAPPMRYDGDYWESYVEKDDSEIGRALTEARIRMVSAHYGGQVIDIGIGGGRFVKEGGHLGFDVNPSAIAWLADNGLYADPYQGCDAITCWDSLEHIPSPEVLVNCVSQWVFVSMPIYKDASDCLKSKHYKPGEHLWYWTHDGLIGWFDALGFDMVESNNVESVIGREQIYSYAFKRR